MTARCLCDECESECNFDGKECPCLVCLIKVVCLEACDEADKYWTEFFDKEWKKITNA